MRHPVRLCQCRAGSAQCETGARCKDLPRLLETDFSLTHKRRRFLWNESPDQGWVAEKGFQLLAERKEIRPWDRRYCLLFDSATLIHECFFDFTRISGVCKLSSEFFSGKKMETVLRVLLLQTNHSTFSFKSKFSTDSNGNFSTSVINMEGTAL